MINETFSELRGCSMRAQFAANVANRCLNSDITPYMLADKLGADSGWTPDRVWQFLNCEVKAATLPELHQLEQALAELEVEKQIEKQQGPRVVTMGGRGRS